ncbi:MAG: pseudouridine synthase [Clostridia bacterium]|nr:pseudouridine synthase [Clostridia bacterium]
MRLQKYIAQCGVASRRAAEKIISQGRVRVNGEIIDFMGFEVDPKTDTVEVDSKVLHEEKKKYYIMLNKPKNYVTTVSDDLGRPTVMELVEDIDARIYPVGRLDFETSGLLLMTNDGDFANSVTHPASEINKVYIAVTDKPLDEEQLNALREGVIIDDFKTSPARVENLKKVKYGFEVKITIHEGKNRQVRKMLEAVGARAVSLKRISVGSITLGNLPEGKWRKLSDAEINKLRNTKRNKQKGRR